MTSSRASGFYKAPTYGEDTRSNEAAKAHEAKAACCAPVTA